MTIFIDYSKLKVGEDKLSNLKAQNKKQDLAELKEALIEDLVGEAEELQAKLKGFKEYCFTKISNYMETAANNYNVRLGGDKGNISLTNKEGTFRVCRHIQDRIVLDEKLQIAKALLDKCLNKWSDGSNDNLKKVVNHAFMVDKQGSINIPRVLSLKSITIDDEDWNKAMEAITDAISVVDTKQYVRLYKRGKCNEWLPISLEISKL